MRRVVARAAGRHKSDKMVVAGWSPVLNFARTGVGIG